MFELLLTTPPWGTVYALARDFFIGLDLLLFVGIIVLLFKDTAFKPAFEFMDEKEKKKSAAPPPRIKGEWDKIVAKSAEGTAEARTLSVIEADKLLDGVLRSLGYAGEHVAERLEQFGRTRRIKALEKVWQAHRIRNNLVHTSGFEISETHTREILEAYRAFFEELGAL